MASDRAEDYLKTIWSAREWAREPVTTTSLAAALGLAPSTVSEQVRRLADRGLVRHAPYRPVELTPAGEREALRVVRRHRLVETYLVAELGCTWDEVHAEAEVLEHALSDALLERMDAKLGRPTRDPHGDPIPTADGRVERPDAPTLSQTPPGCTGVVVRVSDADPGVLRWCAAQGLCLGARVRVLERPAAGGAVVALLPGRRGGADGADGVNVPDGAAGAIHLQQAT